MKWTHEEFEQMKETLRGFAAGNPVDINEARKAAGTGLEALEDAYRVINIQEQYLQNRAAPLPFLEEALGIDRGEGNTLARVTAIIEATKRLRAAEPRLEWGPFDRRATSLRLWVGDWSTRILTVFPGDVWSAEDADGAVPPPRTREAVLAWMKVYVNATGITCTLPDFPEGGPK